MLVVQLIVAKDIGRWGRCRQLHELIALAACIGAPLIKIRYMGDWSNTNDVVIGNYIDPTMSATPVAWLFFGWLVATPPAQ
jgi:hypothetical protein